MEHLLLLFTNLIFCAHLTAAVDNLHASMYLQCKHNQFEFISQFNNYNDLDNFMQKYSDQIEEGAIRQANLYLKEHHPTD